jgi:hypothetical protein
MQPAFWDAPVELSSTERVIVKRIKRARLFVFLREHRHELFTEAFQQELATAYQASTRGQPPIPERRMMR